MPARRPRRKFGPSQKERIFFACLPDTETAARIHRRAEEFKRDNKFEGTLILPGHLHVTLFHLGDWAVLPDEIVRLAKDAAAEVDELQPGDLITYGDPVDHIAFWLGEGRILHSTGRDSLGVLEENEPEYLRERRHKLVRL